MRTGLLTLVGFLLIAGCGTSAQVPASYRVAGSEPIEAKDYQEGVARLMDESQPPARGSKDQPARIIKAIPPALPREAIERGIEGSVSVKLVFDEAGHVENITVLRSPHELLSAAVTAALSLWQVVPPMENGKPVKLTVFQTFAFAAR